MKKFVCCALAVISLFSLNVFAATGSARIDLGSTVSVSGTQLPKGSYKVAWTGEGNEVKVTLTSTDKKISVSAPAKMVEIAKARTTSVVKNEDGSLKEIWFEGKSQALAF